MPSSPPYVPDDLSKIAYGTRYTIRKELLNEVYGRSADQADTVPPSPDSPSPHTPHTSPTSPTSHSSHSSHSSHFPPDSCLPTPEDLTARAGFDRLNFVTAWAELSLKRWAESIAAAPTTSAASSSSASSDSAPAGPAAFELDLDRFERITMQLWRLTAVRKSLLGIEATLDARAATEVKAGEQQVIFLDPRAFDLLNESLRADDNDTPDASDASDASPEDDECGAMGDAADELPTDDPCADFQRLCGHFLSSDCSGHCSRCLHYDPIRDEEASAPDPSYLAALDAERAAVSSAPPLPSSGQFSEPFAESVARHPATMPQPDHQSRLADLAAVPQVPTCPTLAPGRIERTLNNVTADLNGGGAPLPPARPSSPPAAPAPLVAPCASESAPVGPCPPEPPPDSEDLYAGLPESPWSRIARLRFQKLYPHRRPEEFRPPPPGS